MKGPHEGSQWQGGGHVVRASAKGRVGEGGAALEILIISLMLSGT